MMNVIIIPARSGSQRLKNKNLLMIGKKTLIEKTIIFSKKIRNIDQIIVSSNDSELTIELVPEKAGQNLSLEEWSLSECGSIVKECAGVTLRVATLG